MHSTYHLKHFQDFPQVMAPSGSRYGLFAVLGLVAVFLVAWIVDIAVRPLVNAEGLKGALNARSRSKVDG